MRKWPLYALNVVILALVGFFVWRGIRQHWNALTSSGASLVSVNIPFVLAAAIATWLTYLLLIAAWRFVLQGWDQQVAYVPAIRIWCLSNLGRYLPGKVWAIAGMAAMARRQGIDGWAAGASALVMQALAVTTGAAVIIATFPTLSSDASALNATMIGVAAVVGAGGVAVLMIPRAMTAVEKVTAGRFHPKSLSLRTVAAGAASTLLSWLVYGLAFWLLARGLLADGAPRLPTAIGSFAAGYVLGLIAVFVPGGLGVREGVLFALLAPQLGGPPALVLVAASRLLLSVTEIVAALVATALPATTAPNQQAQSGERTN